MNYIFSFFLTVVFLANSIVSSHDLFWKQSHVDSLMNKMKITNQAQISKLNKSDSKNIGHKSQESEVGHETKKDHENEESFSDLLASSDSFNVRKYLKSSSLVNLKCYSETTFCTLLLRPPIHS